VGIFEIALVVATLLCSLVAGFVFAFAVGRLGSDLVFGF
jgi:hypothetical protein